jgi:hypothetical protein
LPALARQHRASVESAVDVGTTQFSGNYARRALPDSTNSEGLRLCGRGRWRQAQAWSPEASPQVLTNRKQRCRRLRTTVLPNGPSALVDGAPGVLCPPAPGAFSTRGVSARSGPTGALERSEAEISACPLFRPPVGELGRRRAGRPAIRTSVASSGQPGPQDGSHPASVGAVAYILFPATFPPHGRRVGPVRTVGMSVTD